jgi:hypothetical protein
MKCLQEQASTGTSPRSGPGTGSAGAGSTGMGSGASR